MKPLRRRFGNRLILLACSIVSLSILSIGHAFCTTSQKYVANQYIIEAKAGSSYADVQRQVEASMRCHIVSTLPVANTYLIALGNTKSIRSYYSSRSITKWVVKRIQPNYIYTLCDDSPTLPISIVTPKDNGWDNQWDMNMINMPKAWGYASLPDNQNNEVVVAVNDTGVGEHPDFDESKIITPGYDVHTVGSVHDKQDPRYDVVGHGTHVAGTIIATGNSDPGADTDNPDKSIAGICGINMPNVKILPVKIFGNYSYTSTSDIVNGYSADLDYYNTDSNWSDPVDKRMVVNMSYGGARGYNDTTEYSMIKELYDAGIILVAAAGNDGLSPSAPASYNECIAVSAVDTDGLLASYSNYGKAIDIAAPGTDIYSTVPNLMLNDEGTDYSYDSDNCYQFTYGYDYKTGTSMAAPHVTGAAAFLMSYGVMPCDVRSRLLHSASMPTPKNSLYYGAGVLDLSSAFTAQSGVSITAPVNGSVFSAVPTLSATMWEIDPSTINVYVGAYTSDDDIPQSGDIVTNWTYDNNTLTILPTAFSSQPLQSGKYYFYVEAKSDADDTIYHDYVTFTISDNLFTIGKYNMMSFPYVFNDTTDSVRISAVDPYDMFRDVDGNPLDSNYKIYIQRYDPFNGYTLYSGTDDDIVWNYPMKTFQSTDASTNITSTWDLMLGGGIRTDITGNDLLTNPAGSGYWVDVVYTNGSDSNTPTYVTVNNDYLSYSTENYMSDLVDSSKGFKIRLYKGWNLIGNPYLTKVPVSGLEFSYGGDINSFQGACDARWVSQLSNCEYSGSVAKTNILTSGSTIDPYKGYWIKVNVGGTNEDTGALILTIPKTIQ